jgi:hypothetical protein
MFISSVNNIYRINRTITAFHSYHYEKMTLSIMSPINLQVTCNLPQYLQKNFFTTPIAEETGNKYKIPHQV